MKITHRVPPNYVRQVPVDPAYQRQVDIDTARRERDYARAQRAVVVAEARVARIAKVVKSTRSQKDSLAAAEAALELRRLELINLHGVMAESPAGSTKRGKGSFRGVPGTRPL